MALEELAALRERRREEQAQEAAEKVCIVDYGCVCLCMDHRTQLTWLVQPIDRRRSGCGRSRSAKPSCWGARGGEPRRRWRRPSVRRCLDNVCSARVVLTCTTQHDSIYMCVFTRTAVYAMARRAKKEQEQAAAAPKKKGKGKGGKKEGGGGAKEKTGVTEGAAAKKPAAATKKK